MALKENIKRIWNFISKNPYVKAKANEIIFGTDTYLGRLFDVILTSRSSDEGGFLRGLFGKK